MKRESNTDDNLIPVRLKEAMVIIGKLFGKAAAIFEECGVNMAPNKRKMVKKKLNRIDSREIHAPL